MKNNYQETHDTWNKVAQRYEDKFMDLKLYNKTYDQFCEALHMPAPKILEIGCGPGNITKYIFNKIPTAQITGIDVAENMIELAKKNIPIANFKVMDCRNIDQIKSKFDGIVCGFTIPYLSPNDCSKLISHCKELLNNDGFLYLSFVEGDEKESGYISGSTGDRTFFYYHNLNRIKSQLKANHLTLIDAIELDYQKSEDISEKHTVLISNKV